MVPEALFVVRDGLVQHANPTAAKMLGATSARALVGKALDDILGVGERARVEALVEQYLAGWRPPAAFRLRFRNLAENAELLTDTRVATRAGLVILAARDITETTRGEALVRKLADVSAHLGTVGSVDELLDACEPIFLELGWVVAYSAVRGETTHPLRVIGRDDDPVAVYGRSLLGRALTPEEAPIATEVVRTQRAVFLDNPPTVSAPAAVREARRLDESMRAARVRRSAWCPVFRGDELTHVLSVAGEDVTEHDVVALQLFAAQIGAAARAADLRQELVQRERLAAMGEMSAVLAHEIRNPLAVVFNAVSGLKRETLSPGAAELVGIIDEEAQRLRAVVSEILDFTRGPSAVLSEVDVHEVVASAVAAAEKDPATQRRDARVTIDVPDGFPFAHADRELLRRALVNLIVNALCHATPGTEARVVARESGDLLRVSVWNAGMSIPGEAEESLFRPFFTTRDGGTGLGLFVALRAVEACGGAIELDDVPDGAQFSVWMQRRR